MSGFQELFARFKDIKRNFVTPLHEAVYDSNTKHVKDLLGQDDVDITISDELGNVPLHIAVEKDNVDIVKLLLEKGASVEARTNKRNTPLHMCTSIPTVNVLLEHGACLNASNDRKETLLHQCVGGGTLDLEVYAIKHGASVNAFNIDGETALHQISGRAFNCENISSMQMLLKNGADLSIKDASFKTALHHASRYSSAEAVKLLLDNGAELDAVDSAGNYPIHYTVTNYNHTNDNYLEWLPLFCPTPQHVNFTDIRGRTILHLVAECFDEHVVQFILEMGGIASLVDYLGKTFLHYSVKNNIFGAGIVDAATKNGMDVNIQDKWGQTSLHEALTAGNMENVAALVKVKADIQMHDITGVTPLHVASMKLNPALAELLIKAGADVNARDDNDATPLHFAAWSDVGKVIHVLLENGADKTLIDTNKDTPIMTACFKRSINAIKELNSGSNIVPFTSCSNECMTYDNACSLLEKGDVLRTSNEGAEELLKSVLETPYVGRGADSNEAKEIQMCIEHFVQTIAAHISKKDPRLKCSVLHAGSSSEGTKTRSPDEFDFMLCLENLSEQIDVAFQEGEYGCINLHAPPVTKTKTKETTLDERAINENPKELAVTISDYVRVDLKKTKDASAFYDITGSYEIPCVKMFCFFGDMLQKVIFGKDFPAQRRLLPIEVTSAPSVIVRWIGRRYKELLIDIDIVPAVILPSWSDNYRQDLNLVTADMAKLTSLAVPKLSAGQDEDLWRSSLALVETAIFRRLRPDIRNSYILCKAMMSTEFLPQISFGDYSAIRQHYIDQNDSLSSEELENLTFYESPESLIPSYVLKMTFLAVVEELAREHGLAYVYNEVTESNTTGQEGSETSSSFDESTGSQGAIGGLKTDSLDLPILPNAKDAKHPSVASCKTNKSLYGPAIDMYQAERSLDFRGDIVVEVIERCRKNISEEYVPSFFNERHNVLGERILTGDAYKVEIFFKLLEAILSDKLQNETK